MFEIVSNICLDQSWSQMRCYNKSNIIVIVLFKKNIIACATLSLTTQKYIYENQSRLILENDIVEVFLISNQIIILDTDGNLIQYEQDQEQFYQINTVGHIPCKNILSACFIEHGSIIACISADNGIESCFDVSVYCYNIITKDVTSCVLNNKNKTTNYKMVPINTKKLNDNVILENDGSTEEIIVIGCEDGNVITCLTNCKHNEILHQCRHSVVDVFITDKGSLYFVQSDGCLIEYTNRNSMQYLSGSELNCCRAMDPNILFYSDSNNESYEYNISEDKHVELPVKGVIDIQKVDSSVFMLTLQSSIYLLEDRSSDVLLSKIEQLDSINERIAQVESELRAFSMFTRANQLKCHFLNKLKIIEGELDSMYKFKLELMHTCDGIIFEKDCWRCHICYENDNVVLPLENDLIAGHVEQLEFVLSIVPKIYVTFEVNLVSGPNYELKIPVCKSSVTLLSFCSPLSNKKKSIILPFSRTIKISENKMGDIKKDLSDVPNKVKSDVTDKVQSDVIRKFKSDVISKDGSDVTSDDVSMLHKILIDIRFKFTKDAWDKILIDQSILLKYKTHHIELCIDLNTCDDLVIKSDNKSICSNITRAINYHYIQSNNTIFYSDFVRLNTLKQQLQIDDFENKLNMPSTIKKLEDIQFL